MSSFKKQLKFKKIITTTTTTKQAEVSPIVLSNALFNLNNENNNENLSDDSINEGSSYWNTEKLCEFNDNSNNTQMKLLRFHQKKSPTKTIATTTTTIESTIPIINDVNNTKTILVHKSCSNDSDFTTIEANSDTIEANTVATTSVASIASTSGLNSKRNSIISRRNSTNKSYLQLPTTKLRRTSLPSEERPSPNISPRRFLDYLRREFSSEDLKRRNSKSPILNKKPLSVINTPKILWSNTNVDLSGDNNNNNNNDNTQRLNKIFKSCDIDLTDKTGVATNTTTTGALSLSQATAAASALLLPNMPQQQQQSNNNNNNNVVVRSRKSVTHNEHSTHLSVVNNEQQPSYFSKRRNTISTIAFHKLSAASINTGGGGGGDKKSFDYPNGYDGLQEAELFELVEQADIDNLKLKIDANQMCINCSNEMGLSPLDVAIMLNHVPMIRLLVQNGAKESKKFLNSENRYNKICKCLDDIENNFINFEQFTLNPTKDYDRKITYFESRIKLLKRMKLNYEQAGLPESPTNINLHVTSKTSLTVTFDEPLRNNGAIVTNYKVEWCNNASFDRLDGEALVTGIINKDYEIKNLVTGNIYYVRVSCSNMKGYSTYCLAEPAYAIPNSWKEGDSIDVKLEKYSTKLNDLKSEFKKSKENFDNLFQSIVNRGDDIHRARKSSKGFRRNLINLFMPSSHNGSNSNHLSNSCNTFLNTNTNISSNKFVKQLKKGAAYLVMIAYDNEKIIITQDDNLPMVEIDDHYQLTTLQNDMQFLIKISMNWDEIKTQKKEMEQSIYTSNLHFRYQLLKVTCNLKNLMELSELGRVYNQPLKDQDGNIYFILTKKLKNATGGHNLKVIQINKFLQKTSSNDNNNINNNNNNNNNNNTTVNSINSNNNSSSSNSLINKDYCTDLFAKNLKNIIEYDRNCDKKIAKGLYLGYLRVQSSMDLVKVMVLNQRPSILPCQKIRDNPNVSKEEWELINEICDQYKQQTTTTSSSSKSFDISLQKLTEKFSLKSQYKFVNEILKAIQSLGSLLELNQEQLNDLKIYTNSVIEINKDISLLLIYPPAEQICIIPHTNNNNNNNNNNDDSMQSSINSALKKSHSSSKFDQLLASISNNRYIYLPIQIFETLNLFTYDRIFIKNYSKLSTSLDIEYNSTLQYQREAFSNDELTLTKQKLAILLNQQHKLDDIWKESRWLIDVINNARDKNKICGLPVDYINEFFMRKYSNIEQLPNKNEITSSSSARIPSVIIQNDSETEEQTSTLNLNDEFDANSFVPTKTSKEYSYLSSGYQSEEVMANSLNTREFLEQLNNNNQSNFDDFAENVYSSISYINLKNFKLKNPATAINSSKVNIIQSNVSPTSSSTSSISMSASSSTSSASTYCATAFMNNTNITPTTNLILEQNQKDEFTLVRPKINVTKSTSSSTSSSKSSAQLFYNENCDDEPIELNYNTLQPNKSQSTTPVTSLTQSFSSLIASVYNYKTIVVHLALDTSTSALTTTTPSPQVHRMVNFKINSNTTSNDVIKYTLNAFDIIDIPLQSPTKTPTMLNKKPSFPRSLTASPMRSIFPTITDHEENSLFNSQTCLKTQSSYCLVIVIGCRERVLKDSYCLFQLKDPWVNGRFYIRLVNDALAALKLDKKLSNMNNPPSTSSKQQQQQSNTNSSNSNIIINSIDAKI